MGKTPTTEKEKTYVCKNCGRRFSDKKSYDDHVRLNSIELFSIRIHDFNLNKIVCYHGNGGYWLHLQKVKLNAETCSKEDDRTEKKDWYIGKSRFDKERIRILDKSKDDFLDSLFCCCRWEKQLTWKAYDEVEKELPERVEKGVFSLMRPNHSSEPIVYSIIALFDSLDKLPDSCERLFEKSKAYRGINFKMMFKNVNIIENAWEKLYGEYAPKVLDSIDDLDAVKSMLDKQVEDYDYLIWNENDFSVTMWSNDEMHIHCPDSSFLYIYCSKISDWDSTISKEYANALEDEEKRRKESKEREEKQKKEEEERSKKKEKAKEESNEEAVVELRYKSDDLFIMRTNVDLDDGGKYEGAEAISGNSRAVLEQAIACAKKNNLDLNFSFKDGKTETHTANELDCWFSFEPIEKSEFEVLKKFNLMKQGSVGYKEVVDAVSCAFMKKRS